MKGLDDTLPLTRLSIPGTHDTGAYNEGGAATLTQSMDLGEQLRSGIRAWDIRLRDQGGDKGLGVFHGPVYQRLDFADNVLYDAYMFLEDHPKETVLIRIKYEPENKDTEPDDFDRSIADDLQWYIDRGRVYVPPNPPPADSATTLGDVRGKIVILENFTSRTLHRKFGLAYGRFDVQDVSSLNGFKGLGAKWRDHIRPHLEKAAADPNDQRFYVNYLSGEDVAKGTYPYFVASGHASIDNASPRLLTGWDRYDDGGGSCSEDAACLSEFPCANPRDDPCQVAYEGTNILARDYLIRLRPKRVGMVMADFPGAGLIDAIIWRNPAAPKADAGGSYEVPEGETLTLAASRSSHPLSDTLSYEWDLDADGDYDEEAAGETVEYRWGNDGHRFVALRVTDSDGDQGFATAQVTVTAVSPTVTELDLWPAFPNLRVEGTAQMLSGKVVDPGWLDTPKAQVAWGDGSEEEAAGSVENDPPEATLSFETDHTYGDDDEYTIVVCPSDEDGAGPCEERSLEILNLPPGVEISDSQATTVPEGTPLGVSASATDIGWLDELSATVDWGDGSTGAATVNVTGEGPPRLQANVTASHPYGDNGAHRVRLTVADDDGGEHADGFDVTVSNVAPAVQAGRSDVSLTEGPEGGLLEATATFTDPGWLDEHLAFIDWGDGTVDPVAVTRSDGRVGPGGAAGALRGSHTYGDDGTFTGRFIVVDDDGGIGVDPFTVRVENVDPTAEIDRRSEITVNGRAIFLGRGGTPIGFATRVTDPGSDDVEVRWDFGDGSPISVTTSLSDPPTPDADPSTDLHPRDVLMEQEHVYAPCAWTLVVRSVDDDFGSSPQDQVGVVIRGNAERTLNRSAWRRSFETSPEAEAATLECYLNSVGFLSDVFSELRSSDDAAAASEVLRGGGTADAETRSFDGELLAAWLNFAAGAIDLD
ncbi:MAG TPA: PKD domain-containing protein, partial [Actinomycetota bacterium]|nr:PKD domain-containing protein [Actinomycetota bacterium]